MTTKKKERESSTQKTKSNATHLRTIQDLLYLPQRVVVVPRRLERLHLRLHEDLDVAQLV
jgi:hypothetical protein